MNRLLRVLQVVVLLELIAGMVWCGYRLSRPALPPHNSAVVDALTAHDLEQFRADLSPDDPRSWSRLAELHLVFGSYASAEACYLRADSLRPHQLETLLGLGICQERLGRYAVANQTLARLIRLAPTELKAEVQYRIGRNCLRNDQAADAEQAFRQCVNFPPALYQTAKLLLRTDRAERALPLIEALLRLGPDVMESNQLAEQCQRVLGHRDRAAEFRERLERCPNRLATGRTVSAFRLTRQKLGAAKLLAEAEVAERTGHAAAAVELYEQVWPYEPAEPIAVRAMELRLKIKQPEAALNMGERQIELGGISASLLEQRGQAKKDSGDLEAATSEWRRSLTLLVRSGVCRALANALRDEDAKASRRYQALADFAEGVRLYRLNRLAEAMPLLKESLRQDPEHASGWYYLGAVQALAEEDDVAAESWRRCLKLDPGHGRAFAALQSRP